MVGLTYRIIEFRLEWCTPCIAFNVSCQPRHSATAYATSTMGHRQQCVPAPLRRAIKVLMALLMTTDVCWDMTQCLLLNIYQKDRILPAIWQSWLANIYQWRPGCPELRHVERLNGYKSTQHQIPEYISLHLKGIWYTVRSVHNAKGYHCYQIDHEYVWWHSVSKLLATMQCIACHVIAP